MPPRSASPVPRPLIILLFLFGAATYASLATWLARVGGARWVWGACAIVALGVAAVAAARIGTANPYSRTARWDPLLFFVMAVVLLGAPLAAASYAAVAATPRGAGLAALWSAGAFLLAIPVGFVAAVAIEVLWPH